MEKLPCLYPVDFLFFLSVSFLDALIREFSLSSSLDQISKNNDEVQLEKALHRGRVRHIPCVQSLNSRLKQYIGHCIFFSQCRWWSSIRTCCPHLFNKCIVHAVAYPHLQQIICMLDITLLRFCLYSMSITKSNMLINTL